MIEPRVGDVLCTRTGGWTSALIRFGAALRDEPNLDNHVVVVHHRDRQGRWWGIEGRPGGVGWHQLTNSGVLASHWTLANTRQPKAAHLRPQIAKAVEAALGTPYDWRGIALDAAHAVGLTKLYDDWPTDKAPGHVVCSSLAAWAYRKVGAAAPGDGHSRTVTPADWSRFIELEEWTHDRPE